MNPWENMLGLAVLLGALIAFVALSLLGWLLCAAGDALTRVADWVERKVSGGVWE